MRSSQIVRLEIEKGRKMIYDMDAKLSIDKKNDFKLSEVLDETLNYSCVFVLLPEKFSMTSNAH